MQDGKQKRERKEEKHVSDNWVVQNLNNSLESWNEKLAEVWELLTQSPEEFRGGGIWTVIQDIHGALLAIGLALLVLFFRYWSGQDLRQFHRGKTPGTRA